MTAKKCRFCGEWITDYAPVHYSTRHYAHPHCFLKSGRELGTLKDWQVVSMPFRLLQAFGLLAEAEAADARTKSRQAKKEHTHHDD